MTGLIYAAQIGHNVKIGYSARPDRREASLRSEFKARLKIFGVIPATYDDEQRFHRENRHCAIFSEVYPQDAPAVAALMNRMTPYSLRAPTQVAPKQCEPAATIIRLLGGDTKLAQVPGVHRTRVANWKLPRSEGRHAGSDGSVPQKYHAQILRLAHERGLNEITAEMLIFGRQDAAA